MKLARSKAASGQTISFLGEDTLKVFGSGYVPRDGRCPPIMISDSYTLTKRSHGGSPSPIPLDPPEERDSQEFERESVCSAAPFRRRVLWSTMRPEFYSGRRGLIRKIGRTDYSSGAACRALRGSQRHVRLF